MKNKNLTLPLLCCIGVFSFIFSLYLAPYHTGGDQEHYNNAYLAVANVDFFDAFDLYKNIIYTVEPIHFVIIWFFSSLGMEKNYVMAGANALLAIMFYILLLRRGYGILQSFILLVSNYYIFTMFFTLERTKFAFIFLIAFMLYNKFIFILLSLLSHTLILIPIISHLCARLLSGLNMAEFLNLKFLIINSPKFLFIISAFWVFYNYFSEHILYKFMAYSDGGSGFSGFEGWQTLFLLIFTLLSSRVSFMPIFFFLSLFILANKIGGDRVTMISYFAFIYYSDPGGKYFKALSLLLAGYMLIKSVLYFIIIFEHGG